MHLLQDFDIIIQYNEQIVTIPKRAMADTIKVLISGGGTGGHVYPGIAIANELIKKIPDIQITFVGVKGRIESKIVPREGFPLKTIHIQYLSRKLSIKTFTFFFSLLVGLVQSFFLLLRFKPNVVIGTGGYVSGPVLFSASLLGIPTLIQEQNSYPGITTKLLAPKVKRIHLAFEEATQHLTKVKDKSKFKMTGNPVRLSTKKISRYSALQKFGFNLNKKTLLLFGGSQGASPLNIALLETLPKLSPDIQIIWQTGEPEYEKLELASHKFPHKIFIQPFIYNMSEAYKAADLAFCRAGAITIAELAQMGVPSILVPFPHAAENHQKKNAQVLAERDAAVLLPQNEMNPEVLKEKIESLIFNENKLAELKRNCQKYFYPDAAAEIAQSAIDLISEN